VPQRRRLFPITHLSGYIDRAGVVDAAGSFRKSRESIMVYHGTVKSGVIELEEGVVLPDGTWVKVEPLPLKSLVTTKRPGTSLADWAEKNAEDWGDQMNSENVESFTGRRF
jgi:hypothetical protein